MYKNTKLSVGFLVSNFLNVLFLLGLVFVSQTDNMILLWFVIVATIVNAIFLIVKSAPLFKSENKRY